MDVDDECRLVAIAIGTGSSCGGWADDWWVTEGGGGEVIGAVNSDEESWLVGGGEGKRDPLLLLSSSYEIILFGRVGHVRLETDRLKAGGR